MVKHCKITRENKQEDVHFFITNLLHLNYPLHTNSEVNISHETTNMVVWIYDGI